MLTASPRVLVLDEPTSALDPAAAEEVLNALARLVHDLGLTVLMAEHRLERVLPFADRIVLVPGDGAPVVVGSPAEVMRTATVAPPLVELGRFMGWQPLPLTVRDAGVSPAICVRALAPMHPPQAAASTTPPPGGRVNHAAPGGRVGASSRRALRTMANATIGIVLGTCLSAIGG